VSVLILASTDGSRWIALLSDLLTSLVVLGRYGLCSYLGTPPGVTVCDPARALSVVADRCGSKAP